MSNNLFSYLPTSEQAEILVRDEISREYIKWIYFESELDAAKYREKFEKIGISVGVNKDIFKTSRREYSGFQVR